MMKLKTYIPFALILLLPALLPEAAALRAQTSRNSFLKVSVCLLYTSPSPRDA